MDFLGVLSFSGEMEVLYCELDTSFSALLEAVESTGMWVAWPAREYCENFKLSPQRQRWEMKKPVKLLPNSMSVFLWFECQCPQKFILIDTNT